MKKISNYTINYIRNSIEEYYKNCLKAINEIKDYVQRNMPEQIEHFMTVYNKWLDVINEEYQTLKQSLEMISKERYGPNEYGLKFEYNLLTTQKSVTQWQDPKKIYVYFTYRDYRSWNYGQFSREAHFNNLNQYLTFEDAQ